MLTLHAQWRILEFKEWEGMNSGGREAGWSFFVNWYISGNQIVQIVSMAGWPSTGFTWPVGLWLYALYGFPRSILARCSLVMQKPRSVRKNFLNLS